MLQGFRLVFWVQFATATILTAIICFVQPETREDVLLSRKAKKLRLVAVDSSATGDDAERKTFGSMMKTTLSRPMRLLFTEPPIQAWTVYVSFACEMNAVTPYGSQNSR